MKIPIKRPQEIERMREACTLAARTLHLAGKMAQPGTSLNQIDQFVYQYTLDNKAIPATLGYHGYPKSVCTSVNEVVTHGIPSNYILKEGDIVNIDVTSILGGYHGDTSKTYMIGEVSEEARKIVQAAEEAMWVGIRAVDPNGGNFNDIGIAIEEFATDLGYSVVKEYGGHGIGRNFHEDPHVSHYDTFRDGPLFKPGMCFTIEPMINLGTEKCHTLKDKWTVITADGSLSAQFEHTLAITDRGVEVLTDIKF